MNVYELVSKVMRNISMPTPPLEQNEIWVTEITGCLRKAYYNRLEPQPVPPEIALLAAMGRGVHDIVERYFEFECSFGFGFDDESSECTCFREFSYPWKIWEKDVRIVGKPDLICVLGEKRVLIEIKVSSSDNREEWLRQIRYYAVLAEVDEAYLLVVRRDNGMWELKKVTIGNKEKIKEEMESRALELWKALTEKRPPKKERGPWCNYCPYRWKCFSDSEHP